MNIDLIVKPDGPKDEWTRFINEAAGLYISSIWKSIDVNIKMKSNQSENGILHLCANEKKQI